AKLPELDVDAQLSGEEDKDLSEEQIQLEEFIEAEFHRPTGIATLREWGAIVLPAGKHKGRQHSTVFESDLAYAALMARKSSLTSPWAKSFKNYSIARLRAMAKAEQAKLDGAKEKHNDLGERATEADTKDKGKEIHHPRVIKPKMTPKSPDDQDLDGWKLCPMDSSQASASTKRANEGTTSGPMKEEMSADQQLELMTRQALLRRELAQLEHLCKQIDACAFQIEEKLDQLKQNTKAHDWMQHKLPRLDVLEITLTDGSVGNAVRRCRGRIVSLKTFNANKIWQLIYMYEPRHLWIDCGGTIPSKVFGSNSTLLDLYEHQVELGRHFHLCSDRNIFEASSLTGDSELRAILEETLCACHGPSQSMAEGRMGGNNFLNRKRYVYTTSRALHQKVDTRTAPTILSSPAHRNDDTTTQRSTTRPLRLADQAATAMVTDRSIPLLLSELLVVDHKREGDFNSNIADGLLDSAKQVVKRRRLWRKQPHPTLRDQADIPLRQTIVVSRQDGHGPGYMALNEEEKREADPRIIQAAKDYACSVCLETVPGPKLARPASIHVDGDFGDVVGMDVAYWTGKSGQQHMFTHIIDEATLFHQATATGRTVEDQYEALTDSWTKWAGPCQFLYLDPAGEYIGDEWREKIQRDGICVRVAAGESHWQVGRVEAHGKILKSMLTRMDAEEVIASDADFRLCLRAAIQAKNSLSRIRGFTPEQAVFGKSSRLPASLISDEQAAGCFIGANARSATDLEAREEGGMTLTNPDGDTIMEHAGPSNRGVANAEQPEMEVSPVASLDPEPQVLPEPVVPESPMDPVNIPVPEDEDDDILFGDTECFLTFPSEDQVWEINVCETEVDPKDLPSPSEALQYAMLVSSGQKKRTEVQLRDLTSADRQQFLEAKGKEVDAWLSHRTVRK
ncbi:GIP, partial [Symbiodinium pilosum]